MNKVNKSRVAVLIVAGSLLAYGGYWAGTRATASGTGTSTRGTAPLTASPASNVDPATGKRVLYWHDPMVPGKRFDKPGKSPFMDMQLVPVYAEEGGEAAGVKISPSLQQNLGIRFATVRRAEQAASLELVGSTQFDESKAEVVQSRVAGFVDKLHVRFCVYLCPRLAGSAGGVSDAEAQRRHHLDGCSSPKDACPIYPRLDGGGHGPYRSTTKPPIALLSSFRRRHRTSGPRRGAGYAWDDDCKSRRYEHDLAAC
jgi:Heavy metal binding domain